MRVEITVGRSGKIGQDPRNLVRIPVHELVKALYRAGARRNLPL
jgi:hypothetical protein